MTSILQAGVEGGWFSQLAFPTAIVAALFWAFWRASAKFSPLIVDLIKAHLSMVKTLEKSVEKIVEAQACIAASQSRIEEALTEVVVRQSREKHPTDV